MDEERQNLIKSSKPAPIASKTPAEANFCKNYAVFSLIFCVIVAIFLIFGYKATLSEENLSKIIEKSPFDARNYRFFRTANDISALLVQTPANSLENACVSLTLSAGFAQESAEIEGLSHLLGHLIVFRQEKSRFRENSGVFQEISADLRVEAQITQFFWCFPEDLLEDALKTLVFRLKSPQISTKSVAEAVSFIEAEYLEEKTRDFPYKTLEFLRKMSRNSHFFAHGRPGNRETLGKRPEMQGVDVLARLDAYFREFYSANLMSFVVISRFPLDFVEKLAKERLCELQNNRVRPISSGFPREAFEFHGISRLFLHESRENAGISLVLAFPVPSKPQFLEEKPLNFLISLIKMRGKNSLLGKLRDLGLSLAVDAGFLYEQDDFVVIFAKFDGISAFSPGILEILRVFRAFLRQIAGNHAFRGNCFEIMRRVSTISAAFEENPWENADFLRRIARNLKTLPLSRVVNGDKVYGKLNGNAISQCLEYLSLDNCVVVVGKHGLKVKENAAEITKSEDFRFTNLSSLRKELQLLKESREIHEFPGNSAESQGNPQENAGSRKEIAGNHAISREKQGNSKILLGNSSFFQDFLSSELDSFDDYYKFHYKTADFPRELRDFVENLENSSTYFNESHKFSLQNYVPTRLSLYFPCENQETFDFVEETLPFSLEKACFLEKTADFAGNSSLFEGKTSFPVNFLFESRYFLPKIAVFLDIVVNFSTFTTKTHVLFAIFCELSRDFFENSLYDALFVGNSLEIRANPHGLEFFFELFNDHAKNQQFFSAFLEDFLGSARFSQLLFEFVKEKVLKALKNDDFEEALRKSLRFFEKILTNFHVFPQESALELQNLSFEEFVEVSRDFAGKFALNRLFVFGNYRRNQTIALCEQIIESFKRKSGNSWENASLKGNLSENPGFQGNFQGNLSENATFRGNLSENATFQGNLSENTTFQGNSAQNNTSFQGNLSGNFSENTSFSKKSPGFFQETLLYSNVSFIPLTVLRLKNETVRFFFDDRSDFFLENSIILHYFQYGVRESPREYAISLCLSWILQEKFARFLANYSVLPENSLKSSIDLHVEKNVYGQLLRVSFQSNFSAICVEFLLEKFYLYVFQELSRMSEAEFAGFLKQTRATFKEIDASFREKARRLWLEMQNQLEINEDLRGSLENCTENLTKREILEFFRENYRENPKKMEIKIENSAKDKEFRVVFDGEESFCGISPEIVRDLRDLEGKPEKNSKEIDKNWLFNELLLEIQNVNATKNGIKELTSLNELESLEKYVFNF